MGLKNNYKTNNYSLALMRTIFTSKDIALKNHNQELKKESNQIVPLYFLSL